VKRVHEAGDIMQRAIHATAVTNPKLRKTDLRDEALMILEGRGRILDTAREVSRLMREAGINGVVIGGVAVVLHGHIRTTIDVDILSSSKLEVLRDLLTANDFSFDKKQRAFIKRGVVVHLVQPAQVGIRLGRPIEIDGISTVSLVDLINMKLRSGSENLLRAQDLADVIGLIRHHRLTNDFAKHVIKTLRPAFRKLVRMINQEKKER